MSDLNLKPVAPTTSPTSKPIPSSSILKPWIFEYIPSPDSKDVNLLIMFHGLGDTKAPFAALGKQLNLPSTAISSLQAPDPLPLMDNPAFSWYNTFTPLFEPLPNPSPAKAIPSLVNLLTTLTSEPLNWQLHQIHLFGWGQGGTMALELALKVGKTGVSVQGEERKRLGSVTSICAGLISHPSAPINVATPCLLFTRLDPKLAAGSRIVGGVKRGFGEVEVVYKKGQGEDMPRGRDEWIDMMRFWSKNLGRADEGWQGEGEVYEVVR